MLPLHRSTVPSALIAWLVFSGTSVTVSGDEPRLQMLVPGFEVQTLPIELTSLNNIEYSASGKLFAGGYDGRFHLLRDTNGDGLEDSVETFSPETNANYPLGIAVKDETPYFVLTDEVVRFVDTNNDGVPDQRETVAKNFDDPELQKLTFLHKRRVDSSMGLAIGPRGEVYVTMGNAGFSNPYWHDGVTPNAKTGREMEGEPQYSTTRRRGCLLRIDPDGKVEQLASGLRYVMSLQFNRYGDLFASDQEGATWSPNGNPFDELLHLEIGKHYGFPPRHPRYLPSVVDEPSVWDYSPQHQSTCGFRFNGPLPGRERFGPTFWADDVIMTGESRGKLWRTSVVKTSTGYLATNQLIGSIPMLVVDCAISPAGELLICCHTGAPDWGNGPQGAGRLFKIRYKDPQQAQPVLTAPLSDTETFVAFDRPLDEQRWQAVAKQIRIDAGHFVSAADRLETMRPGYAVVQLQQKQRRSSLPVTEATLSPDRTGIIITTPARKTAYQYAIALPQGIDVAHDLSGTTVHWQSKSGAAWQGWLPHLNLKASQHFTRGSQVHQPLWDALSRPGDLHLRGQLDLWQIVTPAVQPRADLGYALEPESTTVIFRADAAIDLKCEQATIKRINEQETELTFTAPQANAWLSFELRVATPCSKLEVTYRTPRDDRERPLPGKRCLVPFAQPAPTLVDNTDIPQLAGGDFEKGHQLFLGKAACATCHQFRGEGARVGADLGNITQRDYDSVLRDLLDPNATLNPDAVGYVALLNTGTIISGTRIGETETELQLAVPGGKVETIRKTDLESLTPMKTSLMPTGLDKLLTQEELRDLLTYLLTEKPKS